MRRVLALASVIALSLTSVAATDPESKEHEALHHCVVEVLGVDAIGNFVLGPEVCFKTLAEALSFVGVPDVDVDATPADLPRSVLATSQVLGIHYEHSNLSGSSLTIRGTSCVGGGLNLSSSWNDRISSTFHGLCGTIKHYEHIHYGGAVLTTYAPWMNMTSAMNDETSSIKYFG